MTINPAVRQLSSGKLDPPKLTTTQLGNLRMEVGPATFDTAQHRVERV